MLNAPTFVEPSIGTDTLKRKEEEMAQNTKPTVFNMSAQLLDQGRTDTVEESWVLASIATIASTMSSAKAPKIILMRGLCPRRRGLSTPMAQTPRRIRSEARKYLRAKAKS